MKRRVGWPTRQDPSCSNTQNLGQVVINGKCQPNLERHNLTNWGQTAKKILSNIIMFGEYLKFHNELGQKMKG